MERTEHEPYLFQTQPGMDVTPYLAHAVAATLAVFGLPAALIMGLLVMADPDPSIVVTTLISVTLSGTVSVIGAWLWMRQPASLEISFGDLMLWGWLRRRRAEANLDRGTALLGLDRRGQPVQKIRITRDRQLKVLHDLNDALEAKDPYTRGHSERVERHVYRTAAAMGLSVHDLQELRMAAALHDIGKIRVPDAIIRKPGALTTDEMALMQEHSAVGAWMLSHVASADVIAAVKHHHERWDGKGYPDGLAGTDIPLFARIIAVSDTYDAITSTRPYRARSEHRRAIEVIRSERGSQFDPLAVDAFLSALPTKVPITAILIMLPGAGRALRQIAVGLKRAGAASLASATTAVSASVAISAATIVPAIDRVPVRLPESAVQVASGQTSTGVQASDDEGALDDDGPKALEPRSQERPDRVLPGDRQTLTSGLRETGLEDTAEELAAPQATLPAQPATQPATEPVDLGSVLDLPSPTDEDRGGRPDDKGKPDDRGTGKGNGNSGGSGGTGSGTGDGNGKGKGSDKGRGGGKDDAEGPAGGDEGSHPGPGAPGPNDPGSNDPGKGNSGGNGNPNDGSAGGPPSNGNGGGGNDADTGGGNGSGNPGNGDPGNGNRKS